MQEKDFSQDHNEIQLVHERKTPHLSIKHREINLLTTSFEKTYLEFTIYILTWIAKGLVVP